MLNLALPSLASNLPRIQMGYGWHMRDGGYMMGGSWGAWPLVHIIFWVLFFVAILVLIVIVLRSLKSGQSQDGRKSGLCCVIEPGGFLG